MSLSFTCGSGRRIWEPRRLAAGTTVTGPVTEVRPDPYVFLRGAIENPLANRDQPAVAT
jgi:hypothetical protein